MMFQASFGSGLVVVFGSRRPGKRNPATNGMNAVGDGIRRAYAELVEGRGMRPLALYMECGRCITGPYGYLVSRVRHIKDTYRL